MATKRYLWNAQAVADVWTITVVAVGSAADEIGVTINGKTVSYAVTGSDTTSTAAEALRDALILTSVPEFRELSWSVDAAVVTGTGSVEGVPHALAQYETGTANVTVANTVAATGPEDFGNADNWTSGTLPVDADDIIIASNSLGIRYGLSDLSAVSPASILIDADFVGEAGLPEVNANGYREYRGRYLTFAGNPTITIGEGDGRGSSLINLSAGTGSSVVTVHKTGARRVTGSPALCLSNGGGNNTLVINNGDVGVAAEQGTTAAYQNIRTGSNPNIRLTCGTGATLTNIILNGGQGVSHSAITSLTMGPNATSHTVNAGAITAAVVYGGTLYCDGTSTYSSLTARKTSQSNSPRLEFARDSRAKTVSAAILLGGGILSDPNGVIATWSSFQFDHTSLVASNVGPLVTLSRTA